MLSVAIAGTCTSRKARIAAITNKKEMLFKPKHATKPNAARVAPATKGPITLARLN